MRDDDKRPPIRGAVHAESQRQTHLQKRVRQDTRGMRGKACRADKNDESRNRSRKEKGKTGIRKGATTNGRPLNICGAVGKEKNNLKTHVSCNTFFDTNIYMFCFANMQSNNTY